MCLCIAYSAFNVGKDLDINVPQGLKSTFYCISCLSNNIYGALYIGKDISISYD